MRTMQAVTQWGQRYDGLVSLGQMWTSWVICVIFFSGTALHVSWLCNEYITAFSHLLLFLLLNMRLGFWSEKLTLFLYCPCFMGILKVLGTQGFLLYVACNVCWRTIPRKTHFHLRWITFSVVCKSKFFANVKQIYLLKSQRVRWIFSISWICKCRIFTDKLCQ